MAFFRQDTLSSELFFYFLFLSVGKENEQRRALIAANYHSYPRFQLLFERKTYIFLLNSLRIGNIALHLQAK